jgi:hypothetical protein
MMDTDSPPGTNPEAYERAKAAHDTATEQLSEAQSLRAESTQVHKEVRQVRRQNHFAQLMKEALGGSR